MNIGVKKLYIVMFLILLYLYSVDYIINVIDDKSVIYINSILDFVDIMDKFLLVDFFIIISIKFLNISWYFVVIKILLFFIKFLLYIFLIEFINVERIRSLLFINLKVLFIVFVWKLSIMIDKKLII